MYLDYFTPYIFFLKWTEKSLETSRKIIYQISKHLYYYYVDTVNFKMSNIRVKIILENTPYVTWEDKIKKMYCKMMWIC